MGTTHYQDQEDDELLTHTAAGDSQAFEVLYKRYENRLYQYLRMTINDDTLAEDILVEVMVAIWEGAKKFKGASKISTWMFGIARHKALDALRSRTRTEARSESLDNHVELPDQADGPGDHAERNATGTILQKGIQMLSLEHQEVVYLAFYEGMSYHEISTLIKTPVNTVKTRVYYAKQRLKGVLQELGLSEEPSG